MKKGLIIVLLLTLLAGVSFGDLMNNRVRLYRVPNDVLVRWTQVAMGPDGVVHVVYQADVEPNVNHPIMYLNYDGKTVSTPINLLEKPAKTQQPHIAVGSGGHIAVVWGDVGKSTVMLRSYDPVTKIWSPTFAAGTTPGFDTGEGPHEPMVAVDGAGNIHVFFWSPGPEKCYARSKINGVWENIARLTNIGNPRSKQGGLAVAPDGKVWACWREIQATSTPGILEYKTWYSKRTLTTNWAAPRKVTNLGQSSANPWMMVAPDGTPGIIQRDQPLDEGPGVIFYIKLDEQTNPIQTAMSKLVQHYSRGVFDVFGNVHIVTAAGAGDAGDGCYYNNNIGGAWNPTDLYGGYMVKAAGIAADRFGNVVVSWSDHVDNPGTDIWINSLSPIFVKTLKAPTGASMSIKTKVGRRSGGQAVYTLSWQANPETTDSIVQGYKIYMQESGGDWQVLTTVSKTTLSAPFTFQDINRKRRFAVTTVSLAGSAESDKTYF
jgi:hypothetical protein